jgi:hypothetical protein
VYGNVQHVQEVIMMHQAWYVLVLVLAGVIGMPALTATGLFAATLAAGRPRRAAWMLAIGFVGLWAAWIAVSGLLADAGAYRQDSTATRPWIGVAAAGILAVALAGARIPAVRAALAAPGSLANLTWPHVLRVVGVVFLVVMVLGRLPAVFSVPAGLGDIAIGLTAPVIARRLARGERTGATWFNVLGLLDLVIAVSIGFLAGLGPSQILDVTPSTADLAVLPLVLIPTTAVPLALALHITSLMRLRTGAPARSPHATAVPA